MNISINIFLMPLTQKLEPNFGIDSLKLIHRFFEQIHRIDSLICLIYSLKLRKLLKHTNSNIGIFNKSETY